MWNSECHDVDLELDVTHEPYDGQVMRSIRLLDGKPNLGFRRYLRVGEEGIDRFGGIQD